MPVYIHCVFAGDGEERLTRHYLIQVIKQVRSRTCKKKIGLSTVIWDGMLQKIIQQASV